MAKFVKVDTQKNKKKKVRFEGITMVLFLFSAMLYLVSCLFIHQLNNQLATTKTTLDGKVAELQKKNEAIAVEIEGLSSIDRINEIAAADNIGHIQDNIITINDGEAAEEE